MRSYLEINLCVKDVKALLLQSLLSVVGVPANHRRRSSSSQVAFIDLPPASVITNNRCCPLLASSPNTKNE
jgi:hypothetical protein